MKCERCDERAVYKWHMSNCTRLADHRYKRFQETRFLCYNCSRSHESRYGGFAGQSQYIQTDRQRRAGAAWATVSCLALVGLLAWAYLALR
jgi:hypothetical protein